jgi:hypothetical protein
MICGGKQPLCHRPEFGETVPICWNGLCRLSIAKAAAAEVGGEVFIF